jgi:beta-glucosidase
VFIRLFSRYSCRIIPYLDYQALMMTTNERYKDSNLSIEARIADLLARMTIEEKAGLMFHNIITMNADGTLTSAGAFGFGPGTYELVQKRLLNHFNLIGSAAPDVMAEWHNRLQKLAEGTRLSIPVSLSTDPRHGLSGNIITSAAAGSFSQWCEPIGFAAIDDEAITEQFANIARQEYIAVGIRAALHPQADLATEPRWARIYQTFGEDAQLAARHVAAYIRGFQQSTLGTESVACMTKHFPGGGPQKDGEDPHFAYGKEQVYPGKQFDYHLLPFEAAFAVGTAQMMPYYGVPIGIGYEEVGFAFNKEIVTGLLREKYGFQGVICTDWGLLTPVELPDREIDARAWGIEHFSVPERAKRALDAGVDQFGGEACPEVIVELVNSGQVSEARIDESVRRLLRLKFQLGLFDEQRYVDVQAAVRIVGKAEFRAAGEQAQRKSIVLLKNGSEGAILPIQYRPKLYIENVDPDIAARYGAVVQNPDDADIALLRLKAPFEPRNNEFLEAFFHAGDLDFKEPEKSHILGIINRVPTIVDIFLERPAVIPEIAEHCAALFANFGASDTVMLDAIFGKFAPTGKLPFELPSSMEAVRQQKEDVPYDSENPVFPFGFGLTYE